MRLVSLVVCVFCSAAAVADDVTLLPTEQEALANAQAHGIIVGVTDSPPFCSQYDGKWIGLSIELLKNICETESIAYTIKDYTIEELLVALEKGEVAMAAAALDVTADRAETVRFSHAFHHAGYGVAINESKTKHWATVKRFFSSSFFLAVGFLGSLLLAMGLVIAFVERKQKDSDFGGTIAHGIGSGLWWSAVTMSTVGYGDKSPRTVGGRTVATVWIFLSMIVVSGFTGVIASSLTVNSMKNSVTVLDDLRHMDVATVHKSTANEYLTKRGVHSAGFETLELAIASVQEGKYDAVVHDAPILRHMLARQRASDVVLTEMSFGSLAYAFGFPVDSYLARPLNVELLAQIESDQWAGMVERNLNKRE